MKSNITDYIDEREIVEFAKELARIPSFKEEETPIARFLESWFRERGYEVELQEVEPGRYQTIARLKGTGNGRSLMLNGHIDINSLTTGWDRNPWEPWEDDGKLYGHGLQNMKGGLATMIMAAEAFRKAGRKLSGDIVVACVAGETQGGVGTSYLMESGLRTDAAILTEPFGPGNICTMHAGIIHLGITVKGYSGHISRMENTIHAINKMAGLVKRLETLKFSIEANPQLPKLPLHNVGSIIGGRGESYSLAEAPYVPDICTIVLDVHFLPGQTADAIIDDIERHLAPLKDADPELDYAITLPPPEIIKGRRTIVMESVDVPVDSDIVRIVAENYEVVAGKKPNNVGAVLPLSYSACDSSSLWAAGIPSINYGPTTGINLSGPEGAYVAIDEMVEVAKVIALSAEEFCK